MNRLVVVIILLSLFTEKSFGTQIEIDSLKGTIFQQENDTLKILALKINLKILQNNK